MKTPSTRNRPLGRAGTVLGLAVLVSCLLAGITAKAKPRRPGPPQPELGLIFHEDFDQSWGGPSDQVVDGSVWVESWSGYALTRADKGQAVSPWVVAMVGADGHWNIDPQEGVLRFWYRPDVAGSRKAARLLTLATADGGSSAVWWSLVVADGEIQLVCQSAAGEAVCLSAPVFWEGGSWHLVTLGYSETRSTLYLDDQVVASGGGLASVPALLGSSTSLVIGSELAGREVAQGQIEEFTAFSGPAWIGLPGASGLGVELDWAVVAYYANYAPVAALGPVTEAEEAAWREWAAAGLAEKLAAEQAASALGASGRDGPMDGGGFGLDWYDPSEGFWLLSPEVSGTNIVLTLTNCDTSISYDLLYAREMGETAIWNIRATGVIGQTSFTLPRTNWQGYYLGRVGEDWDLDGVANVMDADPRSTKVGILTITIEAPTNGAVLY